MKGKSILYTVRTAVRFLENDLSPKRWRASIVNGRCVSYVDVNMRSPAAIKYRRLMRFRKRCLRV